MSNLQCKGDDGVTLAQSRQDAVRIAKEIFEAGGTAGGPDSLSSATGCSGTGRPIAAVQSRYFTNTTSLRFSL